MDGGVRLAHQEEGESSDADSSNSNQRRLHGGVLADFSGVAGVVTEPILKEEGRKKIKSLNLKGWKVSRAIKMAL